MPTARKYPEELLQRATRLAFESGRPIAHVARDLPEILRVYVRRTEGTEGRRKDCSAMQCAMIKALRKEVAQLRRGAAPASPAPMLH